MNGAQAHTRCCVRLDSGRPGFDSRLRRDFSRSNHTSDFKTGTPVATLPGTWRYRVRAGTGWPGVSILQLGEIESLICNFCLNVAARNNMSSQIRPWDTQACCWDVRQPSNQQRKAPLPVGWVNCNVLVRNTPALFPPFFSLHSLGYIDSAHLVMSEDDVVTGSCRSVLLLLRFRPC